MAAHNDVTECLECIEEQLQEIEMLQSMFPGEKELIFHDPTLLIETTEYRDSDGKAFPFETLRCLCFQLNLRVNFTIENVDREFEFEISFSLPKLYPVKEKPLVSVISNDISRTDQSSLNKDLKEFIENLEIGEIMLLEIITWLQEHAASYWTSKPCSRLTDVTKLEQNTDFSLAYMWLYMHHIYNKEKRKNIINRASELELTGFSLPGKPGVVYVEGDVRNVDDYFERLRRLSWKRMSCKVKDELHERKFSDFQELCFGVPGGRDYHMDMGKFFIFLKEKQLGHMFKELFGVDGHD